MLNLIVRWILLALALMLIAWIVPGIAVTNFFVALLAAVVIGFINVFIRPIVLFLSIPINIVTLGLFTFIVNALMLLLVSAIVPGFTIDGFLNAILGSLLLSVLSVLINWASGEVQHA